MQNSYRGVRNCLVDYYSLWDIDASDVLPPYVKFFDKLQDNFEHLHEFAIDIICLGQDEATNCMSMELAENGKLTADENLDDLDECLSVAGWMENFGLKKLDAREYAADFRVRGYECRNEKFLKENFKCLYPTTQTRKADLDVCSAALREAIAVKGEACEAMDEYITCSREIFADECGQEVSSFVCNLVQIAMLFNYPMCRDDFHTCQ
ncbi:hypothetical protein PRIPAC_86651 [Pristionchus pacificus]|uniref:Uncharacterized protein n=1 Tax=Pristionchus pacificus TaxID=54126 RepID=A0A2A6BSX7_PRIPA|nr:hypothetical protein PRIPAC_86651 [Pristionchus pacificus]|eukprot:PDM69000.1 hypothetical protein PRIPAC_47302 [Pristionchus pacificus]